MHTRRGVGMSHTQTYTYSIRPTDGESKNNRKRKTWKFSGKLCTASQPSLLSMCVVCSGLPLPLLEGLRSGAGAQVCSPWRGAPLPASHPRGERCEKPNDHQLTRWSVQALPSGQRWRGLDEDVFPVFVYQLAGYSFWIALHIHFVIILKMWRSLKTTI